MAESLINTKRRINTIKSTEKITKAMKLVASVKFQRWKHAFEDNAVYSSAVFDATKRALQGVDFAELDEDLFYLNPGKGTKTIYIVFTSTLGLCGGYNYNLFKMLDPEIRDGDEIILVGQKGYYHYKDKNYTLVDQFIDAMDKCTYSSMKRLRHYLYRQYKKGEFKEVKVAYTIYKNSMTFIPDLKTILPLDLKDFGVNGHTMIGGYNPILAPDDQGLLDHLIPHYSDALLYQCMLNSQLSELASRRNAMESATDSAEQITSNLQITYNKARQAAITQEITEIVAGATAGKDKEN